MILFGPALVGLGLVLPGDWGVLIAVGLFPGMFTALYGYGILRGGIRPGVASAFNFFGSMALNTVDRGSARAEDMFEQAIESGGRKD